MGPINRRDFNKLAVALGATAAWGKLFGLPSLLGGSERRDLFPEGVASGDPDSNSVLLWTRYPREKDSSAELRVEVAEDDAFKHVVATAKTKVSANADWTCRVLVGNLHPAHVYWYRFIDKDGNHSRIGRTITAPDVDDPRPVSFVFISCPLGYCRKRPKTRDEPSRLSSRA